MRKSRQGNRVFVCKMKPKRSNEKSSSESCWCLELMSVGCRWILLYLDHVSVACYEIDSELHSNISNIQSATETAATIIMLTEAASWHIFIVN